MQAEDYIVNGIYPDADIARNFTHFFTNRAFERYPEFLNLEEVTYRKDASFEENFKMKPSLIFQVFEYDDSIDVSTE